MRLAATLWLALAALALVAMWPTTVSMVEIWWRSGTFQHAFAVPPLVGWLAWRSRDRWLHLRATPDARWWPLVLACSALVLASEAALANAPGHFGLVALLVSLVPALLGVQAARALAFPMAYAFFMVPFGEFLMPQMMEGTATFTVWALRASGVPVFREGLNFVIPSGNWSVVEACSGIRYLIASLSVASLFAYLTFNSLSKRLAFVALSAVVPVVANWLRAYLIVMLGHLSDNRVAAGVDHLVYGWVFFGVVMAVLFAAGMRWADPLPAAIERPAPHTFEPSSGAVWRAAAACAALAAGPLLVGQLLAFAAGTPALKALPQVPGWAEPKAMEPTQAPYRPFFAEPDAQEVAVYAAAAGERVPEVGLHRTVYQHQTRERKLLSTSHVLVRADDPAWALAPAPTTALAPAQVGPGAGTQAGSTSAEVRLPYAGGTLALQPVVLAPKFAAQGDAGRKLMVVQLVKVDGRWMPAGTEARLALAWARLRGHSDQAISWVLHTEVDGAASNEDPAAAIQSTATRLGRFIGLALAAEDTR